MNSKNDREVEGSNSPQVYVLAHAVRPNKKSYEKKELATKNQAPHNHHEISMQIKEEIKKSRRTALPRQPRSHLPMKMIVSKMATRKPTNDKNKEPASKLDLSTYRKYPLEPPPWRNRVPSMKRQQPSQLQKVLSSMKAKCAELNSSSQHNHPIKLNNQPHLTKKSLEHLLCDSSCDVLDTPRLDYNYNQLYRGRHTTKESLQEAAVLDEDPLGVGQQTIEGDHFKNGSSPEPMTEFVWNPVVLHDNIKSQLFPHAESESVHQLSPSQLLSPLTHNQELPSCFDTPTWESSSTSSEQTIAEERLQLTIYANRGNLSMFGSDYLRRSHSPTNW